ncbi:MAG TPA: type II toxin-antitoxin system RelE/ParE family toxin [Thermoanaerobaculia bacterium]|nr:type II toxin-antitoxin system RelE/ParE family toxin [Thermoanaerobaculia bacterium]
MPEHQITFARSARKELETLNPPLIKRVLSHIDSLKIEPRPPGCRKLVGSENLWRIRIGEYRVVYSISDSQRWIDVIAIRHRKDVYR